MGAQQQAHQISDRVADRGDSDEHNVVEVTDHMLTYTGGIVWNNVTWVWAAVCDTQLLYSLRFGRSSVSSGWGEKKEEEDQNSRQ